MHLTQTAPSRTGKCFVCGRSTKLPIHHGCGAKVGVKNKRNSLHPPFAGARLPENLR